jgi:FAD/FMN-containing dehydrogenase
MESLLARSSVFETTPWDYPIAWGDSTLRQFRELHCGAFVGRLESKAGTNEVYFGVKLKTEEAAGLARPIPLKFRAGAVAVSAGAVLVLAVQFLDDASHPLDIEHLADPANPGDVSFISDLLAQERWLLPVLGDTGAVVTVKLIPFDSGLTKGFRKVAKTALRYVRRHGHDWSICPGLYDRSIPPGSLFL